MNELLPFVLVEVSENRNLFSELAEVLGYMLLARVLFGLASVHLEVICQRQVQNRRWFGLGPSIKRLALVHAFYQIIWLPFSTNASLPVRLRRLVVE